MSAQDEDLKKMKDAKDANLLGQLASAARSVGTSPITLGLDFRRLSKGRGKLTIGEYLRYGLYDRAKWTEDERSRFVSSSQHWPMVEHCIDHQWWAVTEDKWVSSLVLDQADMPTPRLLAVFDNGPRVYPKIQRLANAADLEAFLKGCDSFPIFAKATSGVASAGALKITGVTDTHVEIVGREPATFAEVADTLFGNDHYIIQKFLKPHAFFDGLTEAMATIRCLNLIDENGVTVPYTALKLPGPDSFADNFWRDGNMVGDVDPETGEIRSLVRNDNGDLTRLTEHPVDGRAVIGETLPDWDEMMRINKEVALIHAPNRFASTDMALTRDGPVVVEVNNGCAFELIQIATGRGLLTDDMIAFFRKNGVKI
ncbi:sugar-transfer associated ATP-grasp domain-containing protein [Cognatiyoonia sp. IB215446]|uniref:sugar-transfer associated ATP-grasp domain-containing protein n=1 Tax=Cognatiyoonia sp. IB215446 TaxID=3097355 RepID=UPI002A15296C|nr:sugar-transfer associated ATP-grasp domain-containing protein [Cognatiyoonia sp. IB215446]MDX8348698.1 sugar-transfer associated ATP-grasp domain-containing protein [Cognatiyoonia sp. IB215446]